MMDTLRASSFGYSVRCSGGKWHAILRRQRKPSCADKLELAETLGAVATVDAAESNNPARAVRELTGGGAHVSVDALGIEAACRNSLKSLRKRGRHVQIGLTTGADKGDLSIPIDLIVD